MQLKLAAPRASSGLHLEERMPGGEFKAIIAKPNGGPAAKKRIALHLRSEFFIYCKGGTLYEFSLYKDTPVLSKGESQALYYLVSVSTKFTYINVNSKTFSQRDAYVIIFF